MSAELKDGAVEREECNKLKKDNYTGTTPNTGIINVSNGDVRCAIGREESNRTSTKLVLPIIKSSKGGVLGAWERKMQQTEGNKTGLPPKQIQR